MALRKRGATFLICFRKRYPERGGSLRKGGVPTLEETMDYRKIMQNQGVMNIKTQCYQCYNQCVPSATSVTSSVFPVLPVLQAVCCGNHERIENPVTHLRWSI